MRLLLLYAVALSTGFVCMLKKCLMLGLVLLLAGGGTSAWILTSRSRQTKRSQIYKHKSNSPSDKCFAQYRQWRGLSPAQINNLTVELDKYRQTKTESQLRQEQDIRLNADIEKLSSGVMDPGPFPEIVYGADWQDRANKYTKRRQLNDSAFTASMVCGAIGGIVVSVCGMLVSVRLLGKGLRTLASRRRRRTTNGPLDPVAQQLSGDAPEPTTTEDTMGRKRLLGRPKLPGRSKLTTGWDEVKEEFANKRLVGAEPAEDLELEAALNAGERRRRANRISLLLCDEQSVAPDSVVAAQTMAGDDDMTAVELTAATDRTVPDDTPDAADSLRRQTESLQKQIDEFREMAQSVQQATAENAVPIGDSLKDLSRQMSAIREYASHQQDRVQKLQEGYDWNIIRTFCLRVIRCIDNIENRISKLSEADEDAAHLGDVRDELLFALESSGVEQYRPEINSDYRGQEKYAEAVKGRQQYSGSGQAGKIACVVRPGYAYMMSDNESKIVRTAQVRLYG